MQSQANNNDILRTIVNQYPEINIKAYFSLLANTEKCVKYSPNPNTKDVINLNLLYKFGWLYFECNHKYKRMIIVSRSRYIKYIIRANCIRFGKLHNNPLIDSIRLSTKEIKRAKELVQEFASNKSFRIGNTKWPISSYRNNDWKRAAALYGYNEDHEFFEHFSKHEEVLERIKSFNRGRQHGC